MTSARDVKSGKGSRDENFPVASGLISARHRAPIMAFYRFARAADDVADHPALSEPEKFRLLDELEATLLGKSDTESEALPLRRALSDRKLEPGHALDLLAAFRQDVTKSRYNDWNELMQYCRISAMPVGRFVLDVHGEDRATWGSSDDLCAALQVINHLQDCGKDYRAMNRVYVPLDALARHGARVEDLGAEKSTPALRACLAELTAKTAALMPKAGELPRVVHDARLSAETGVIVALANRILQLLAVRDPLSERVHLSKAVALSLAARGTAAAVVGQISRALFGSRRATGGS